MWRSQLRIYWTDLDGLTQKVNTNQLLKIMIEDSVCLWQLSQVEEDLYHWVAVLSQSMQLLLLWDMPVQENSFKTPRRMIKSQSSIILLHNLESFLFSQILSYKQLLEQFWLKLTSIVRKGIWLTLNMVHSFML